MNGYMGVLWVSFTKSFHRRYFALNMNVLMVILLLLNLNIKNPFILLGAFVLFFVKKNVFYLFACGI